MQQTLAFDQLSHAVTALAASDQGTHHKLHQFATCVFVLKHRQWLGTPLHGRRTVVQQ